MDEFESFFDRRRRLGRERQQRWRNRHSKKSPEALEAQRQARAEQQRKLLIRQSQKYQQTLGLTRNTTNQSQSSQAVGNSRLAQERQSQALRSEAIHFVENQILQQSCGQFNSICLSCGTKNFLAERPSDGKSTSCCRKWKVLIKPAPNCSYKSGEQVMADKTSSAKCGQKFRARIVNNILPPPSSSPSRTVFHALLEPIDNAPTTSRSTKRISSIDLHPKKHSRICYERTIGKGKSISQRFGKVNKERWSTSAVSSTLDIDGHSTADDISDEHVNDNISTIKLEVNPESQDNTNSLNEACLTEPASAFIKIEPPDSPPSSQNINLASTSNSIYHSIKEETIIVDEDFERQSTSQLSCDITRSPESPNSNLNIKMEPPDSPSHEDSTVSSSNIKDELLFEVKSEPYVEQTLTKSEVISRMQAISDQLDTLSKKRQRQELKISSNEDPTRLQLLHNLLDNLVTEQTDKQLEYEDLTNMLRQYN